LLLDPSSGRPVGVFSAPNYDLPTSTTCFFSPTPSPKTFFPFCRLPDAILAGLTLPGPPPVPHSLHVALDRPLGPDLFTPGIASFFPNFPNPPPSRGPFVPPGLAVVLFFGLPPHAPSRCGWGGAVVHGQLPPPPPNRRNPLFPPHVYPNLSGRPQPSKGFSLIFWFLLDQIATPFCSFAWPFSNGCLWFSPTGNLPFGIFFRDAF